jgi:hypothetical protein
MIKIGSWASNFCRTTPQSQHANHSLPVEPSSESHGARQQEGIFSENINRVWNQICRLMHMIRDLPLKDASSLLSPQRATGKPDDTLIRRPVYRQAELAIRAKSNWTVVRDTSPFSAGWLELLLCSNCLMYWRKEQKIVHKGNFLFKKRRVQPYVSCEGRYKE